MIHERLNVSLGEELLGLSRLQLEVLNQIDVSIPLEKQSEDLRRKTKIILYGEEDNDFP